MPWHLMHEVVETRGGLTYDESSFDEWMANEDIRGMRVSGHVLLRPVEYERWKRERFDRTEFMGRALKDGRWSDEKPWSGIDLENAHRVVVRLTSERIADVFAWESVLSVYDIDRFHEHYDAIEDSSVLFFEKHLRRDEVTVRVLEGLEMLECLYRYESGLLDIAFVAGMFLRAADVVGRWRGARLDDPERLPGPLDQDVQSVLRGYRTKRETDLHCEEVETRSAAAALHLLLKWHDRKSEPQWAIEAIEEDLGEELRLDDWHSLCADYWAHPLDSGFWLNGEED